MDELVFDSNHVKIVSFRILFAANERGMAIISGIGKPGPPGSPLPLWLNSDQRRSPALQPLCARCVGLVSVDYSSELFNF